MIKRLMSFLFVLAFISTPIYIWCSANGNPFYYSLAVRQSEKSAKRIYSGEVTAGKCIYNKNENTYTVSVIDKYGVNSKMVYYPESNTFYDYYYAESIKVKRMLIRAEYLKALEFDFIEDIYVKYIPKANEEVYENGITYESVEKITVSISGENDFISDVTQTLDALTKYNTHICVLITKKCETSYLVYKCLDLSRARGNIEDKIYCVDDISDL